MCPKRKWFKEAGESYFGFILLLPTLSKVVFLSSPGNPPNSDSPAQFLQQRPCWSTINRNNTNFFLPSIPNSTFNRFVLLPFALLFVNISLLILWWSYRNGRWLQNKKWKEQRKVEPWPWSILRFLQHWMLFILTSIGMVLLPWLKNNFIFDCLIGSNTNWASHRFFHNALSSSLALYTFLPPPPPARGLYLPSLAHVLIFIHLSLSRSHILNNSLLVC